MKLARVLPAAVIALGCGQPPGPGIVRGVNVNGYVFDYELVAPVSIQADAGQLMIRTGKTEIRVADGTLWVAGRSFGAVTAKDRIAVVGDKVTVNGEERAPAG